VVAAQLGVRVVLIERDRMGGECLNTGCVPSKALLAAAKTAETIRDGHWFGIDADPVVDFKRVRAHVRSVISTIAPHDSVERFESLGVEVIRGEARFTEPRSIIADGREIRARRVVIATGSEPAIPPIPGLDQVRFFTNETIFENETLPEHLIVIGGGPIGVEIGQAYRRLGAAVTILERKKAMPKDDPELVGLLMQRLAGEGVAIREGVEIKAIERDGEEINLTVDEAGQSSRLRGSHLMIAAGRKPRASGLGLETAGIEYNNRGIVVNAHLQTTARAVYAAGDVVEGPRFTHVCSYHAGIVIKNALFRLPAKVDYRSLPWVTYTDPELAQVGMTEWSGPQALGRRPSDRARSLCRERSRADRATSRGHAQAHCRSPRSRARCLYSRRPRWRAGSFVGGRDRAEAQIAKLSTDDCALSDLGRTRQGCSVGIFQAVAYQPVHPWCRAGVVLVVLMPGSQWNRRFKLRRARRPIRARSTIRLI
jgi:pyruvate/2-oxoglutarate dehydrogenase complex dihydrolipoamide dehydrogenase (E3) component